VQFTLSDVLKLLPELMLTLLAVLVVVGDLFAGDATDEQRFRDAASTTILGLGMIGYGIHRVSRRPIHSRAS